MSSIDVILVCYNQEFCIRQAVESICMQVLPKDVRVRVVVADDHSQDGTLNIIRDCERLSPYPFVYLPQENNLGIAKNYKRSFKATTADYVAILEGDDYWSSVNHLSQHLNFLQNHSECSMSMNRIFLHYVEKGNLSSVNREQMKDEYELVTIEQQIAEGNQLGNLSACVFRGKFVRALPDDLFDMSIADWMLGILMAEHGPLAILKEPTSVYRVSNMGMWAKLTERQQILSMIKGAHRYDKYHNYKYHALWKKFLKKQYCHYWHYVKHRIKFVYQLKRHQVKQVVKKILGMA